MDSEDHDQLITRIIVSVALIVVLLGAGFGLFRLFKSLKKEPVRAEQGAPRTAVRVEEARRGPYREILRGYGLARALRSAEISAEVTGIVEWVSPALEAGAIVEEGQEMVRLDRRNYEQARDTAKARMDQATAALERLKIDLESTRSRLTIARADLEASQRELERVASLAGTGVLNKSDLDRQKIASSLREKEVLELSSMEAAAGQEILRAKAEIAAAQASLDRAINDLDRTVVVAPYDGRIDARFAETRGRVGPGAPLFRIVDLLRVEVPVALGASRFGDVKVGARAAIRLREGGDVVWNGQVARVSPTVNTEDRTFHVFLVVEGSAASAPVPPGAFVLAEVDGPEYPAVIAVPRMGFVAGTVYIAVPDDGNEATVSARTPTVVEVLPETVLVGEGLEDGELVIVTNIEQIANGERVLLVRDLAPAEESPR